MALEGIDVSEWQGFIDWQAVKRAGIFFAGIKASEGIGGTDPQFARNWHGAKAAGVRRIAYHFLRPFIDGDAQANHFHRVVHDNGKFGVGDSVMLDVEVRDGQPAEVVMSCIEGFIANILRTTHCGVSLYTGPGFWNPLMAGIAAPGVYRCPLWSASWGDSPGSVIGWPHGPSFWQYSGRGTCPGVDGPVDRDRFLGTPKQYDILATMGGRQ